MMKKILVIEDEKELLENLAFFLTLEDYDVYSANNGENGISIAFDIIPDLIICDINMPGIDGYEVLKQIRTNSNTRTTPFIFLTAHSEKSFFRQGMDLGADDYVSKPYTDAEILSAVRTRLEKHKAILDIHQNRIEDLRKSIASTLPHELKTPLSVILAYSDILASSHQELDADEIVSIAKSMNSAGKRLHRLFDNYIYYTELFEYQLPESIQKDLLTKYADQSIKRITNSIDARYPKVQIMIEKLPIARLKIITHHFDKLIEELVENAFKFSSENTTISISATINHKNYLLSIKNTGVEFTQDQIENIGGFMQFNRKYIEQQGIGLGLAIVKKILDLYDSNLKIYSSNGQTEVVVDLPLID